MNTRTIIASLNDIANELDNSGLFQQANTVTDIMVKLSQSEAPGESGKAYRTEANLTTPPTADYATLINHVKGLMSKRDPESQIELAAIWNKAQRNGYNFTPQENNAFQRQFQRIKQNRNQDVDVDEIMYQIFKKWMPKGVTVQGINDNETNIVDEANKAGVANIDMYLQKTREMLDPKAKRTQRGPTGRHENLRGFGEHEKPETGYYGFGK